ncbi:MAG TPA: YifB family Mg chelatase-like AAA ATPase [Deltaproteobacteria bacterium]|nr:YifB family Mg chelatase-like AAA ATPase [Deltaproteobacteria bacterium]
MIAHVHSATPWGVDALGVVVEVDIQGGLPSFSVVGLPDSCVKESRERVRSAIVNSGLDFPPRRITVNLAPADVRKEGGTFDLPVAVAILTALGHAPGDTVARHLFVGELGLDGSVRPVRGVLSAALLARRKGFAAIVCPFPNAYEARLARIDVYPATTLTDVLAFLRGERACAGTSHTPPARQESGPRPDLLEVNGQAFGKRGLEIAAAGGHNLLFVGPPGAGKSMLARRLPSILPALSEEEILVCTAVYSAAGLLGKDEIVAERPFRSPHHTISDAGLVGGGSIPTPGEVSLAHKGVLFLDEMPEFRRSALEALRQPLEDQTVRISRANATVSFPADFQLLAAMNPCPCGYLGHPDRQCSCTPTQVARYRARVSGPLLDRIDMHLWIEAVPAEGVFSRSEGPSSQRVRSHVEAAREVQKSRGFINARIPPDRMEGVCRLDGSTRSLLVAAVKRMSLSMRAVSRVIKVARTIADLDGSGAILENHVAEALQFRPEGTAS